MPVSGPGEYRGVSGKELEMRLCLAVDPGIREMQEMVDDEWNYREMDKQKRIVLPWAAAPSG